MNRLISRGFSLLVLLAALAATPVHATQQLAPSKAAQAAGEPYLRALQQAAEFFATGDPAKALSKLDDADQIAPNIPDTWNWRGTIYAEQHAYEKAEDAFQKAARLNPQDFWPPYNLAELLLVQKKFGPAATAFKKLEVYKGQEELVQFKIVFADILNGNMDDAKKTAEGMKFPCNTAAYYFAQAAYAFASKDEKQGNYWVGAGLKVFTVPQCASFYDSLVGIGFVKQRGADGSIPQEEGSGLGNLQEGAPKPAGGGLLQPGGLQ